jgi:nucleoside-diphosphate-sugar epimerase
LLRSLIKDDSIESIVGVARRLPDVQWPKTEWVSADITSSPLEPIFRGADAVVHLAWLIQPSRHLEVLRAVNVDGSRRVFEASGTAGVGSLVYGSSVGAYSPGPKNPPVDESWPTGGISSSFYSSHKAETERILDEIESRYPALRVVRLRPSLIFKREAATEVRRLFLGPLVPAWIMKPSRIPVVPSHPRLAFQAVHSYDIGEAYRLAVTKDVRGAFNIAADPIIDSERLARLFGARSVPINARLLRSVMSLTWKLRIQPSPPGWLDMGLQSPLLDSTRARTELGWQPGYTSEEALLELLDGMRNKVGMDTPTLNAGAGGPARIREFLTGIGGKSR